MDCDSQFVKLFKDSIKNYSKRHSTLSRTVYGNWSQLPEASEKWQNKLNFDINVQLYLWYTLFISIHCEILHACKIWLCSIFMWHEIFMLSQQPMKLGNIVICVVVSASGYAFESRCKWYKCEIEMTNFNINIITETNKINEMTTVEETRHWKGNSEVLTLIKLTD